jgi:hypothetical protein
MTTTRHAFKMPLDQYHDTEAERGRQRFEARAESRPKTERESQIRELAEDAKAEDGPGPMWVVNGTYGADWYAYFWRQYNSRAEIYIETGRAVDWLYLARLAFVLYARAEYDLPQPYAKRALAEAFGGINTPETQQYTAGLAQAIRSHVEEMDEYERANPKP